MVYGSELKNPVSKKKTDGQYLTDLKNWEERKGMPPIYWFYLCYTEEGNVAMDTVVRSSKFGSHFSVLPIQRKF